MYRYRGLLQIWCIGALALVGCSGGGSDANLLTIIAQSESGGSITPSGVVEVARGADQTFTITPDEDYIIDDVQVDSVSEGPVSNYVFENLQADHVIVALFTVESEPIEIRGSFNNNVADIVFDHATVNLIHKRDIDEFEDGCITSMDITLTHLTGCRMHVTAGDTFLPQGGLQMRLVEFSADSFCPGFPDSSEGSYSGLPDTAEAKLGNRKVDGRNVALSSVTSSITLRMDGSIYRNSDGEELIIDPTEITLTGEFPSSGNTEVSCPEEL